MFFSPLMLLSMAASGLGSFLTSKAENDNLRAQQNARNNVLMMNDQRQQQFTQDAQNELAKSVDDYSAENQGAEREAIKAEQTDKFKGATDADIGYHYGDGKVPKNLQNAVVKSGEESKAVADRDAGNLAGMNAFTQGLFDTQRRTRDYSRNIGQISDQAFGQERLVPIEMIAAANNAKKKSSGLGTLLQLAGGAGSMFAGSGGFGGTEIRPFEYGTRSNGMPVIPGFGPGGL